MASDEWPEPWVGVSDAAQKAALLAELEREMAEGHILQGASLDVVGRSEVSDDVLLAVEGQSFRVAEVHLTYSKSRETDPRWPAATVFPDFETWRSSVPERS